MVATAKIIKNGNSQAVRLPKGFRFDVLEVGIKRLGSAVLLFPKNDAWDLMESTLGQVDPDFMAERNQPPHSITRRSCSRTPSHPHRQKRT